MSDGIKIALIGNGQAARYLQRVLRASGWSVSTYARHPRADELPWEQLWERASTADLNLLCVSDSAIAEVSEKLAPCPGIVAHISGATPLEALSQRHPRRAVCYPLMSLQANLDLPLSGIPFCLEAGQKEDYQWLEHFWRQAGVRSYAVHSGQRAALHLAAVWAHNFSNHLWHKAEEVMNGAGLDYRMLLPLLEQHLRRLQEHRPRALQTGPALRHDQATIDRHLSQLSRAADRQLYQLLSESIQETHDQEL